MWTRSFVHTGLLLAFTLGFTGCDKSSPVQPSPPSCTYTLSLSSMAMGPAGGPASVTVTTASHCAWTAASDRTWMSITGGASGTGNGVVSVSLAPNASETARAGTLTVAGQSVQVQQEGLGPCAFVLAPPSASFGPDSHTGSFSVAAAAHCQWTASSNASWLAVISGSPGTGNGTIGYSVERNRETSARTGAIAVGNATFTVEQSGDTTPPPVCDYSVAPVEFAPCMSAPYTLTAAVTTSQGCTWTATSGASWITVTAGHSGSGPGDVSFTVSDNWEAPRHGVVMVRWPTMTAGQNLQVSQAGCSYAVSTATIAVVAAGGTGRFDVIQASDPISCGGPTQNACLWTAQSDVPWITITTPMPQVGDNPVNFTVAANAGAASRVGRIAVRDKVVQITQAGQ